VAKRRSQLELVGVEDRPTHALDELGAVMIAVEDGWRDALLVDHGRVAVRALGNYEDAGHGFLLVVVTVEADGGLVPFIPPSS
jgi:hypothetical protein